MFQYPNKSMSVIITKMNYREILTITTHVTGRDPKANIWHGGY